MTDNRNRTAADIRNIFNRTNGKLGETGTVAWMFERKGSIVVDAGATDEDTLMTVAIDAGAEDVSQDEHTYEIVTDPADFMAVREALEAAGIAFTSAELAMLPKTTVAAGAERRQEDAAPDGRARGERRRPGSPRQLRHQRRDTGSAGLSNGSRLVRSAIARRRFPGAAE